MKYFTLLLLFLHFGLSALPLEIDVNDSPFNYPIEVRVLPGDRSTREVMICLHGYGSSGRMIESLRTYPAIKDHLVGFNFPDYDIDSKTVVPEKTAFGTINELLPAIYVMRKVVVDAGAPRINLYGFSAGGGALVNSLSVLVCNLYPKELAKIGVGEKERCQILKAIQKGHVIFDVPLKSIEEIIAVRSRTQELDLYEKRYAQHGMRPIDNLKYLHHFNILLHFQHPDEVLSNRDDEIYIQQLFRANKRGNTVVVIGSDGGHLEYHKSLWDVYPHFLSGAMKNCVIKKSIDKR